MRLVSFNVLHGRSPADERVDLDRFASAVRALDADVLLLQEVDRGQPRSHQADLTAIAAAAMDATHARFLPTLSGRQGAWGPAVRDGMRCEVSAGAGGPGATTVGDDAPGYGLAVLSRFPVRAWRMLDLPRLSRRVPVMRRRSPRVRWAQDEPRAALAATLDTPDGPCTAVNTHLSTIPGWNLVQLRRLARASRRLPGPVVLAGDLNLRGRTPAGVTRWRSAGMVPTFPAWAPDRQIDHLLLSGPVRARTVTAVDTGVSDHRALIAELDLGRDR